MKNPKLNVEEVEKDFQKKIAEAARKKATFLLKQISNDEKQIKYYEKRIKGFREQIEKIKEGKYTVNFTGSEKEERIEINFY